jgi:hypothetical protein
MATRYRSSLDIGGVSDYTWPIAVGAMLLAVLIDGRWQRRGR